MNLYNVKQLILATELVDTTVNDDYKAGFKDGLKTSVSLLSQLDEPKKEVVPQDVADFIEDGNRYDKIAFLVHQKYLGVNSLMRECPVKDWLRSADYKTVLSLVNGYEVEKEQLYYVKIPVVTWNDDSSELETEHAYLILDVTSDETRLSHSNKDYGYWKARLTELDIKSIDERFWPFAVKVED